MMKTAYDENHVPYLIQAEGSEAKHIAELLTAEADGRLVVLPCKVGSIIYSIVRGKVQDLILESFFADEENEEFNFSAYCPKKCGIGISCDDAYHMTCSLGFSISEFGKSIFLTRQEAERALEALRHN